MNDDDIEIEAAKLRLAIAVQEFRAEHGNDVPKMLEALTTMFESLTEQRRLLREADYFQDQQE
jgi:hypothetical protein